MKFGKRLKRQIDESLPEWKDKFLSYKDLKKLVKLVSTTQPCSKAEQEFICLLDVEIDKFNSFFVEQEEDFIIRQRELQERIKRVVGEHGPAGKQPSEAAYAAEMAKIRKDIVNFHGEMVLLVNYSSINYTGLAKILKKYDKRTGRLLRLPFIKKVLEQPFFTTDLLSKLVKECESTIDAVFPVVSQEQNGGVVEKEALVVSEKSILRTTLAALMTMQELRGGSSTISHFSLPPMSLADTELLNSFQIPSPIATQ